MKQVRKQKQSNIHYELSTKGRQFIGKELGITDTESELITNEKFFYERLALLEPFVYVRDIIETYLDELKSFDSEEQYQEFIIEREKELYKLIEDSLDIAVHIKDIMKKAWFRPNNLFKTDLYTHDFVDANMMEIKLGENKIYEAFKYKMMQVDVTVNQKDFIKKHSKCRYLQVKNKLELNKFSKYHQAIIKLILDEISSIIMSATSTVINKRQLLNVGNGVVVYNVQHDVRIGTFIDLRQALNIKALKWLNIEIKTYKIKSVSKESNLLVKKYRDNNIELVNYTEPERISFMRYLDNTSKTESDKLFELNNTTCKLNRHINLDWSYMI